MKSLLCMTPTRWRRENCERLLKSYAENTDDADLTFITDSDDQDTYEGMDWGPATNTVYETEERVGTVAKVNYVTSTLGREYDAYMYLGDDHLFSTPHWDTILLGRMEKDLGGTGMAYGDDRRRQDVPEMIIITSDIVETLGHFAEPSLVHYYIDNCWAELGGRSNLIRFYPDVVFEHLHYEVDKDTERDQTYVSAESLFGYRDKIAHARWRETVMPFEVAKLRRRFNKDLQWLFSKI